MKRTYWVWSLVLVLGAEGPSALAATLSGIIVDAANHQPIPGAYVMVGNSTVHAIQVKEARQTGADGRFVFKNLPSVPLFVSGEKQSYFFSLVEPEILLSPGETRDLEILLGKQITLHVLVVDRQTGGLLAKSHVGLTQSQKDQDIQVPWEWYPPPDPSSWKRFPTLAAGTKGLTIALDGYLTQWLDLPLTGLAWAESLTVQIEPAGAGVVYKSIEGTAKSRFGQVVGGALAVFRCQADGGDWTLYDTAKADGRFLIRGIPGSCREGILIGQRKYDGKVSGMQQPIALPGSISGVEMTVTVPEPLGLVRKAGWVPTEASEASHGWQGTVFRVGLSGAFFDVMGRNDGAAGSASQRPQPLP